MRDPTRPPLERARLDRALTGLWREIVVVASTGSTNADVKALAGTAGEGLVVVAEHQSAGRGRLDRSWTAPPRAGLTFSALLRPDGVPARRWGWLSLAAGLSVATAVSRTSGVDARVKWPNDVLHGRDGRKLAGVLVERVDPPGGPVAVVGIGLNVTQRQEELPVPQATSLLLAGGAETDRAVLLVEVLGELERWYARWTAAGGDADRCGLRLAYAERCATLGRMVRAELPDGTSVSGRAGSVDPDGALVVVTASGPRTVAAGDVVHLSPAPALLPP
jgi:BirA family transcriptional regulator, biotin operon repressor / biotin---[acetyl-CoA-carboxylase] ligase